MIRRGTLEVPSGKSITLYLGAYTATAVVLGMIWLPAYANAAQPAGNVATTLVTDHTNSGNGHHNRNTVSVRSPVHNRGYQHSSNSNAGGVNDVQNALCSHATVCNVTQKVTVITPERTTRQTLQRVEPPPRKPDAPARPDAPAQGAGTPASAGPFLSMGPYGITLVPGPSVFAGRIEGLPSCDSLVYGVPREETGSLPRSDAGTPGPS